MQSSPVTGLVIALFACALGALVTLGLERASGVERRRRKARQHVDAARVVSTLTGLLPQSAESEEESERALARSGVRMAPAALWATRIIGVATGILLGLGLAVAGGAGAVAIVAAPVLGGLLGALMPQLYLARQRARWRDDIDRELPNALDLLCICVQAGTTFDAGLRTVSQRTEGALADALRDVVAASQFQPTTEALKRLADNAEVTSLTMFVASLIQAEQSGMALTEVLRSQAESVRTQRRLAIEEKINKLPVRMTFPCVLIFASMIVITLAPAIAQFPALGTALGA